MPRKNVLEFQLIYNAQRDSNKMHTCEHVHTRMFMARVEPTFEIYSTYLVNKMRALKHVHTQFRTVGCQETAQQHKT